jgi:hypothetical protein
VIYGVTCPRCAALLDDEAVGRFVNRKYLIDADGRPVFPHMILLCGCGSEISMRYITTCLMAATRAMIKAAKEPPT